MSKAELLSQKSQCNKNSNVPKLRFPEFSGEWKEKKLGNIGEFKTSSVDKKIVEGQKLIQLVNYMNVYKHKNINNASIKDLMTVSANETQLNSSNLKKGDILFTPSSETPDDIGHSVVIFEDLKDTLYSYHLMRFRPKVKLDILYSHYFCNIPDVLRQISRVTTGSTRFTISVGGFSKIQVNIPSLEEQQKIAACLSSLDELITLQTQKIESLKTHKKGLMQQLFPAEREATPKLRFPEFSGEWEEKTIEYFFFVGSSKRVLQEYWTDQGVPFYRTRELVSLSKNEPFSSEIFISEGLFSEINQRYGSPSEGDFLISGVGTLGISYQVQSKDKIYFKDGNVLWFKSKKNIVSNFFKYSFGADVIQNQISGQASKSTVGTYTIQNAKITKFYCPSNPNEQKKIADCLSSLDELIIRQAQKIESLKTHKKGLIQQLFPTTDEANK